MGPIAARMGREVGIPTAASWNIREPGAADALIGSGQLDLAIVGKDLLADPHWAYHAAQALGHATPATRLARQ